MSAFLFGVPGKLKTLIDRLTSTRAANLDNLDAAISGRAAAATALSTATWDTAGRSKLNEIGIKSIQRGTITVSLSAGVGSGSNTATITSVTTGKSMVNCLGYTTGSTATQRPTCRIELTNGTTVTANVVRDGTTGTASVTVSYEVIEFN